jgi:hypothetical protein
MQQWGLPEEEIDDARRIFLCYVSLLHQYGTDFLALALQNQGWEFGFEEQ